MGSSISDMGHAVRMLVKTPGFTIAAIAALALGIGANTAIFTVVNTVLLKPLSYPDADRMVEFGSRSTTLANFLSCVPESHAYRRQTSVFKGSPLMIQPAPASISPLAVPSRSRAFT